MNKDTVVGILGAVILVAAMVAIFYYEGTQAPSGSAGGTGGTGGTGSNAFYRTANATGPGASGQDTEEATVNITRQNLTAVEFVLTWTDDIPQSDPDTFRMTVTAPDGRTCPSSQGDSGEVRVRCAPLAAVPTAPNAMPTTVGVGTWTVSVELVEAGQIGGAPPPPVPVPGVTDTGNAWSITSELTYWEAA